MSNVFNNNNDNKIIAFFLGGIVGIIITLIIMFIFSAVIIFLNIDRAYAVPFATISIGIGSFFAGKITGRKLCNKGYLVGLVIGLITFLTITLLSLILGNSLSINTIFHFVIILLSSIIGGITGVNYKKNKKYI